MLKSTTKEGLDLGDEDEKKTLEELKAEFEPLRELMKEVLGDKVEEAIVDDGTVDSLRVLTTSGHGLSANMERIMKAQVPLDSSTDLASGSQQCNSRQPSGSQQQRQSTRQVRGKERKGEGERGRSEQEEKGREETESVRKGQRGRGQEGRKNEEERESQEGGGEQVEKDVTGWTEVTRKKRRKTVQIFVKMNESKAIPMEVNLANDKVEDVIRRIQNDEDTYVTMQGKVLRTSEKLKSCGVTDGCTIQVTSRMRGGGRHKVKKKEGVREDRKDGVPTRSERRWG